MADDYCMRLVADLSRIERAAWNALVEADPHGNPLIGYDFLHALQAAGCASPAAGWGPQFITLWRGGRLAGAVPLYMKGHSYGEYVFDWAWAETYRRHGLRYYPKWLAAVPFTPVGGSRLIAADEAARAALADALLQVVHASDLSSLHVLFAPPGEIELLRARGCAVRHGVQFHWRNAGFADFDDFLARLAQSKRKKIRAERRKVAEAGVAVTRKVGRAISDDDWAFFTRCYEATYAAHGSAPYLNLDFFRRIGAAMPANLLLCLAQRGGRPIAASLGIFDAHRSRLYGRYWGELEHVACLHFECCYYQMIEFAIERGLQIFEGGAQGAHKMARGLDPVETLSAHWLARPDMQAAVERFAAREADSVEHTLDELAEHRAWRRGMSADRD